MMQLTHLLSPSGDSDRFLLLLALSTMFYRCELQDNLVRPTVASQRCLWVGGAAGWGVSELLLTPSPRDRQDVLNDDWCQEGKSCFVNIHHTSARAAFPMSQWTTLHHDGLGLSAGGTETWL